MLGQGLFWGPFWMGVIARVWRFFMVSGFVSRRLLLYSLIGPPAACISTPGSRSIGDLDPGWFAMGWGAFLSPPLLSSPVFWSSRGCGTGSPLPPLVDSPSLPTPSRIGRMAMRQEGGGGDLFPACGWLTLKPFSRRGLAVLLCVVSCVCVCFVLW